MTWKFINRVDIHLQIRHPAGDAGWGAVQAPDPGRKQHGWEPGNSDGPNSPKRDFE